MAQCYACGEIMGADGCRRCQYTTPPVPHFVGCKCPYCTRARAANSGMSPDSHADKEA